MVPASCSIIRSLFLGAVDEEVLLSKSKLLQAFIASFFAYGSIVTARVLSLRLLFDLSIGSPSVS